MVVARRLLSVPNVWAFATKADKRSYTANKNEDEKNYEYHYYTSYLVVVFQPLGMKSAKTCGVPAITM
jgi:hypothetical protein